MAIFTEIVKSILFVSPKLFAVSPVKKGTYIITKITILNCNIYFLKIFKTLYLVFYYHKNPTRSTVENTLIR